MNKIAEFIKKNRKVAGLTQQEFALPSGLGLRFARDLEQGKNCLNGQGESDIGNVRHGSSSGKDG